MKIYVNIKKMGKRKNSITQVPYSLPFLPNTVQELIEQVVSLCVQDYNQRAENQELLKTLSLSDIEELSFSGKISFGLNYGEKKANIQQAIQNALQCFEDGIFRIFYDSTEWKSLKEQITLSEGSELTFVRLTMLSGRMW